MERRSVAGAVLAFVGVALLLFVASSGPVEVWHDPPPGDGASRVGQADLDQLDPGQVLGLPTASDVPDSSTTSVIALITIVVIVLAVLYAVISIWVGRPRAGRRQPRLDSGEVTVLPDVPPDRIALDAAAQFAALDQGSPRNAIVACWMRLEDDVAAAGLPRHPAETSAEFTTRVLAANALDSTAVGDLAALYREARFSSHPMDDTSRRRAVDALQQIHAALGASSMVPASGVVS